MSGSRRVYRSQQLSDQSGTQPDTLYFDLSFEVMTETQTAAASINQMFPAASHFGIYDSVFQIASNGPPSLNTSPIRLSSSSRALHLPSPSPPSSHGDGLQAGRPNHSSLVESELYARLLLPRKKGYPLWRPKPDERLPEECRREGVRIGDVGILNELGGFDFLFNCCLPEDHPVNSGRVPADFRQIQGINESDTTGSLREYGPASYVPSDPSDIHKITIPVPPGQPRIRGVPRQVGAGLTFTSTASKGALLILPEGGMRIDHQQYGKFYRYAAECARSWYAYINGPALDRGAPNGSIYLVTGCDKARAWGVASFTNARPENVSLEFVPGESEIEGGLPEYWFSKCSSAISSSDADDEFEQKSGCVFLRGFKIAVKPPIFMTGTKVGSRVEYISRLDADELVPKPRSNNFAIPVEPQWWLLPYIAPGLAGLASTNFDSEEDSPEDEQALVKHRIYHPSDVINDWILSTNSKAEVAITHDDDWASVIEDGDHYIPGDKELIRRINERYQVLVARGYARIDRQEPSMKLSKFILNSNSLRRSYSEGSLNDPFQPTSRSKVIRRYASASTVLNRNEMPPFPTSEWPLTLLRHLQLTTMFPALLSRRQAQQVEPLPPVLVTSIQCRADAIQTQV
ncbi:hypothetical protein D9757_008825 [Collybiopsis confluens]|uniref:Uncharacterized protein n=1 Tax=Collybiopsis confluens TaxID=2823264 RepID=A0A8H5M0B7_9AGAR|nr:hypothetical protein D9757_008825 [Collybiopsis confluens]